MYGDFSVEGVLFRQSSPWVDFLREKLSIEGGFLGKFVQEGGDFRRDWKNGQKLDKR